MALDTNQLAALAAEVATDPQGLGYAAHLPHAPGMVAVLLNDPRFFAPMPTLVTARAILADITNGAQVLDKLEAVQSQVPEVKWALRFATSDGIDFGHPRTRAMLDGLAASGVITADEAQALKDMANQKASRAYILALPPIDEAALRAAGVC